MHTHALPKAGIGDWALMLAGFLLAAVSRGKPRWYTCLGVMTDDRYAAAQLKSLGVKEPKSPTRSGWPLCARV